MRAQLETKKAGNEPVNRFKSIEVKRSFPAPKGYRSDNMLVFARAYQLGNNKKPHFSVTASIGNEAGGCMHDEILAVWPEIKPIIDLHLSNADNGEPVYAEANGYYWLAGAFGGLGEKCHGGSGSSAKSTAECLQIFADYVRISVHSANLLGEEISKIAEKDRVKARGIFRQWIDLQRPRWQKEAQQGMELLKSLA